MQCVALWDFSTPLSSFDSTTWYECHQQNAVWPDQSLL